MRQLPFSFAVSGDKINSPVVRTVRGHVEQTCAVRDGLCNYRINLWVNETDDTRHVERTVKGVRYLETPLDVIAWVVGLYPEINTVTVPEHEPTDPVMALRKQIEATDTTWRKIYAGQVRPNDVVMWNGVKKTLKEVIGGRRRSTLTFIFSDDSAFPVDKSIEMLIAVKENETR